MRLALLALLLVACQAPSPPPSGSTLSSLGAEPAVHSARVVASFPHDPEAFTQGLFFADGQLYETTGLVGRSTLRRVNLEDGRVLESVPFPAGTFGEGSTAWGSEIIGITWRDGLGLRWDRATLRQTGSFRYPGEGWGLTHNGTDLIMSDGSAELRFLDPATMQERRRLTVTAQGEPVRLLNELEFVNGELLANVWTSSRIARIDPATGHVTGWIELAPLVREASGGNPEAVLNGIAWDPAARRLIVTGKLWPRLYQIEIVPGQ